ncbi:MAG: protein kinase, partial [Chloroflexi bacterium]|nr:protein kinase [Chloroflexota bacterium]
MTRPSWIGQTLGGRYRIDDILGQGGMSAVYKAYDPNLKRVVAIKMIHAHLADDPKFVVRFEEEATAVAQLRHPNIVQVFDFNHDNDVYYMVQEFVAGETLQERLRRLNKSNRRMPLNEAIGYIINICDASGYAHNRGLVHRDIKPANIMVDIHGQAILMDFGIVKITGGEKHTATGAVVGTALYLPPESIRGETPDSRSDQYSLGVTLFEAVSGRPPYEADSAMTLMMMHLNDPLPDLRQLRPEVPPGLVAVIEKALAKGRDERYASMAEFASALRGVMAALLSAAPAVTLADQPEKPGAVPTQAAVAASITPKPVAPVGPASTPPILPKAPAGTAQNQSASASVPQPASGTGQSASPPISPAVQTAPAASPGTASPAQARPKWVLWAGIAGVALL